VPPLAIARVASGLLRRWVMGALAPLDFEIFSKKGCSLSFEWEISNFTTFGPPWKNVGKYPSDPPGKILPTPVTPRTFLKWFLVHKSPTFIGNWHQSCLIKPIGIFTTGLLQRQPHVFWS